MKSKNGWLVSSSCERRNYCETCAAIANVYWNYRPRISQTARTRCAVAEAVFPLPNAIEFLSGG